MVIARLNPSRVLTTTLVIAHVTAVAAILSIDVAFEIRSLMVVAVMMSAARSVRHHALLCTASAVVQLELRDREHATIRLRSGRSLAARILDTSCVTARLTTLNLEVEGRRRRRHVLLVADNIASEDFRRLRVLLWWAPLRRARAGEGAREPN